MVAKVVSVVFGVDGGESGFDDDSLVSATFTLSGVHVCSEFLRFLVTFPRYQCNESRISE